MKLNARLLSMLGSCGAYGQAACLLGEKYDNVGFFTADLQNFSGLDRFAKTYPEKFYNVGIAEQDLVNVAAGFASEGNIAFASTYASFASTRCLDQVSVSMAYMKLNVKLIGLTSGFSVGILGPTHESISDLAIMQALPNIMILSPADGMETVKAVVAAAEFEGPVYIRLTGTMNNPVVYKEDFEYQIGKSKELVQGNDGVILATGSMVAASLKASELLRRKGISIGVVDVHTIRPLDTETLNRAALLPLVITAEEHSVVGGLAGAVSQYYSLTGRHVNQLNIGVPCEFSPAASYNSLLEKYKLTAAGIADRITQKLRRMI